MSVPNGCWLMSTGHGSVRMTGDGRGDERGEMWMLAPVWEQRLARRQQKLEQHREDRRQQEARMGAIWHLMNSDEEKERFDYHVVSVGVLCCDLEVLYFTAALLASRAWQAPISPLLLIRPLAPTPPLPPPTRPPPQLLGCRTLSGRLLCRLLRRCSSCFISPCPPTCTASAVIQSKVTWTVSAVT